LLHNIGGGGQGLCFPGHTVELLMSLLGYSNRRKNSEHQNKVQMFIADLQKCSQAHQTSSCTTGTGTRSHDHLWKSKMISSAGEQQSLGYYNMSTLSVVVTQHQHSF